MDNSTVQQEPVFAPAETQRACEVIYEQIKEKILSGELKPGDKLPSERAMMELLHRSRPSVREALRMLERGGFIRIVPGSRGALILEPNTDGVEQSLSNLMRSKMISIKEMSDYRRVNDVMVSEWAAKRRTDEDIAAITELVKKSEQAMGDYRSFIALDPEFHYLIALAAKNEVACIMTQVLRASVQESLDQHLERLTESGRRSMCKRILKSHKAIAQAIADGDAVKAKEATAAHLDDLRQDFEVPD